MLEDLSADDRINLLMIVAALRSALAMAELQNIGEEIVLTIQEYRQIKRALDQAVETLSRFDNELCQVYLRDSKPA